MCSIKEIVGRGLQALYAKLTKHFTDWMSFLPSDLIEEMSPNTEIFNVNILSLSSAWKNAICLMGFELETLRFAQNAVNHLSPDFNKV